jgi:signal transduction histidine kinase
MTTTTNSNHFFPREITDELFILGEVARVLAARLELPELLQSVLEKITEVLAPAEFGAALLWHASEGVFRAHAVAGRAVRDHRALLELSMEAGESITGKVHAEGRARLLAEPAQVADDMSNLRPFNREAIYRAYGGEIMPISVVAAPLRTDEHGFGVLVLETLHGPDRFTQSDVPFVQTLADLIALEIDRVRLDAEAGAIRQAQEAERLRAEVMATFSHELRTPLAAIKGYATALLLDEVEWPEEKQREFLQLIESETDNLEGMIADILDSALIDVGQLEIDPQPVRLPLMAQEVAAEMQRHTATHRFLLDFPPDFPIVEVDPRRIRQVFRNICDNAIKYSPAGGLIVIRGEVRPNDVVISIADQGVGISPEDLIPLFDKYFRVKAPTGYHVPGTGLGLPVSRAVVEAHGGRIWARSEVGEGTVLYFSIPRTLS